jgi:aminoglycoside phosphotransferase (APT) family kinase protein
VTAVEREGSGWDHDAWRVDTADGPWIVRVAKHGTPAERVRDVRREVAVMQLVRSRLGGWAADAVVVGDECLAYRRVPGVPLQDLLARGAIAPAATATIAHQLGGLIRAIAELDPADAGETIEQDSDGLAVWIAELPPRVATIEHLLTPAARAAVDRFVAAGAPAEPADLVLAHNDLGAEHVIVDGGVISGIVDWSDAAVTDPASDVGRLLRDLGADLLPHVLDGLGTAARGDATLVERAWCYARCLIVEDLEYAVERRPDLVAFELANLHRLYRTA